jgi:glycine dehydrogenase subunit 1
LQARQLLLLLCQNPNFFGSVEDLAALIELTHAVGALFVTVADPIALGLLEAPGKLGSDMVVG